MSINTKTNVVTLAAEPESAAAILRGWRRAAPIRRRARSSSRRPASP